MHRRIISAALTAFALLTLGGPVSADESVAKVANDVNKRMVKLFGSGGFKTLVDFGTGIIVSPEGHVLTVIDHLLDTPELRVHMADGRRLNAKLLASEPQLDALAKIDNVSGLPYFDIEEAAAAMGAARHRVYRLQQHVQDQRAAKSRCR
jgi:serine protease Do